MDPPAKFAGPPPPERSRKWVLPAAAAGLVLLGAGLALAISLPLALRGRSSTSRGFAPLDAAARDGGDDIGASSGVERTYYIAADPVEWDYAPTGKNLCKGTRFGEDEQLYVATGPGTKYTKALFREYTDGTFTTQKKRGEDDVHLGVLGPKMHAEVGDTVVVVLRNNAPFPVNVEAGGVLASPAAPANPKDTVTYRWRVPESAGPAEDGPSSRFWMYRSTADIVGDTQAGLAGPIVVAKRGALNAEGNRPSDVDKELFLMLQVFKENFSPFYDDNMARADPEALKDVTEDDLLEANTKYSINGYLWCNLPGLEMEAGKRVRWYVSSLGSEDAIHTAHWHGIVFNTSSGHHTDQVPVQASSLEVLDTDADNPGTWLFHCHLNDHMDGGMMALFKVKGTAPEDRDEALTGKVRKYHIGAVREEWDYAPFGGEMCGSKLVPFSDNAKVFVERGPTRIGRKFLKARYVEFTDATFTKRKRVAPEWEHLGVMGPVIRAVVGDTIEVTFKNLLAPGSPSVSMHPHGVLYDKGSEGSPYNDGKPSVMADAVPPGTSVVYRWLVPERSGPGPADYSSVMWMYHSHVMESRDPHAGLFGAIIITRADMANEDATPKDVDREFVLSFAILDESHSFLLDDNMAKYLPPAVKSNVTAQDEIKEDAGFVESNLKHSINGYLYCNMPGFELAQGRPTRVYMLALGGSGDMHTPNSAEAPLYLDGQRRQAVGLLPGMMLTADVTPAVAGKGLLQCHIYDHISAGMSALYNVNATVKLEIPEDSVERKYYIAAELVDWDYAPLGRDGCTGAPWTPDQETFVKTTNETLGSRYRKAVFRPYTDETFKTRAPHDALYGILGPTLRAEPGDRIVVHFLNRLNFNASVQLFGGFVPVGFTTAYQNNIAPLLPGAAKPSAAEQEQVGAGLDPGASLAPGGAAGGPTGRRLLARRLSQITAAQAEAEAVIAQSVANIYSLNAVAPGRKTKYEWLVPDASAPGPMDGDAVAYAYVSGTDHIKHINAGLVGAVVIYNKGTMPTTDEERAKELPLLFNIQNEMQSELFEYNLAQQQKETKIKVDKMALTFPESNLMHSINGYVYCNGPTMQLQPGETKRLFVMGFGSEVDMHSPVFVGQSLKNRGSSVYSPGVMPATTYVVNMEAGSPGRWDYYCNILDHINAGMKGRMLVS